MSPPRGRWRYQAPSLAPPSGTLAPEGLAREENEGLTKRTLLTYARESQAILGSLLSLPGWHPLSLQGGRVRAMCIEALPEDLPADWDAVTRDVEWVQTEDADVALRLARAGRTFIVGDEGCAQAIRERKPEAEVYVRRGYGFSDTRWARRPKGVHRAFLPLARLSSIVWLCWDRDWGRPVAVHEENGPLPRSVGPLGPLPWETLPFDALPCHAAADGDGWAAATHRDHRFVPTILSAPGRRWALLRPTDVKGHDAFANNFEWWWTAQGPKDGGIAGWPTDVPGEGAQFASVHLDGDTATVHWVGAMAVYRLRDGGMTLVNAPHTLLAELTRLGNVPTHIPPAVLRCTTTRIIEGSKEATCDSLRLKLGANDVLVIAHLADVEAIGEARIATLLSKDLRGGMGEVQLDLYAQERHGAMLALTSAAATSDTASWAQPLSLRFEEGVEQTPEWAREHGIEFGDTWEGPVDWSLHRGVGPAAPDAPRHVDLRWLSALRSASLPVSAARGDVLDLRPFTGRRWVDPKSRRRHLYFRFDGVRWHPETWRDMGAVLPNHPPLAIGRLETAEDAPLAALDATLSKDASLADLVRAARKAGLSSFAYFAEEQERHWRGCPTPAIRHAQCMVSRSALDRIRSRKGPTEIHVLQVEPSHLRRNADAYDGCLIRTRTIVSEYFEASGVAGAYWKPLESGPDYSKSNGDSFLGEVEALWTCDDGPDMPSTGGDGNRVHASGRATRLALPTDARRVSADDIARRRVRHGVPLKFTAEMECGVRYWEGAGMRILRPASEHYDTPHRARVTLIVVVDDGTKVLRVIERTPLSSPSKTPSRLP